MGQIASTGLSSSFALDRSWSWSGSGLAVWSWSWPWSGSWSWSWSCLGLGLGLGLGLVLVLVWPWPWSLVLVFLRRDGAWRVPSRGCRGVVGVAGRRVGRRRGCRGGVRVGRGVGRGGRARPRGVMLRADRIGRIGRHIHPIPNAWASKPRSARPARRSKSGQSFRYVPRSWEVLGSKLHRLMIAGTTARIAATFRPAQSTCVETTDSGFSTYSL